MTGNFTFTRESLRISQRRIRVPEVHQRAMRARLYVARISREVLYVFIEELGFQTLSFVT